MTRSIDRIHDSMLPQFGYTPPAPMEAAEATHSGMLTTIHRLLRGRYLWVILLAAVLGAGGAYAGYKSWEPLYQSVGQIRVAPRLPVILHRIEDQDISGMYDGYIETQTTLLQSTRVIEFALQTPAWKNLKRNYESDAVTAIRDSLRVSRARGGQMVSVTFTDNDPVVAQAVVQAIVEAYMVIYSEEDDKANQDRSRILENLRTVRAAELKANRDRVHDIAKEYGSRSLDTVIATKQKLIQDLEGKIFELQNAQAQLVSDAKVQGIVLQTVAATDEPAPGGAVPGGAAPDAPALAPEEPVKPRVLTPQEIAKRDTTMATLLQTLDLKKAELIKLRDNRRETHPVIIEAVKDLKRLEDRIDKQASDFNATWGETDALQTREWSLRLESLVASEKRLQDILAPLQVQVQEIGTKNLDIVRYEDEIETAKRGLKEVETRIEQLNVESYVTGRVSVITKGDKPGMPINASVRMRQATMWGAGGVAGAIGLFTLLGFMDRRLRYADDFQAVLHDTSLLGVIPEIPHKNRDPQIAVEAAMSINQIRAMLQLGPVAAQHRVFAVVSGSSGEGKTSVTFSLGTSFANSGARTLLIDFDQTGRNLSARSGCVHRLRLGDILKQQGLVTDEEISQAMQLVRDNGMRIGSAMVNLGYVTPGDVDVAIQAQDGTAMGLIDALAGESLANCVINTHTPRLSVLPVEDGCEQHMTAMAPRQVQDLLDRARKEYDIVLIDTGPLPASLEGSVAAAHADDAIVVISKDSQRKSLERLINHLNSIGLGMAGMVFNRADRNCVNRYGSSSSRSRGTSRSVRHRNHGHDKADFGPLAMATSLISSPPLVSPENQSSSTLSTPVSQETAGIIVSGNETGSSKRKRPDQI